MWNSSASKAASKQDYLTVCYNRTTDFGAQFKLARLEWFTCIDQVTLIVNKMESLKQFLNKSFTGEMGDYLTSSESTNSRHDCISDDLLSLPIQKYAEIFQAHQAHVTSFLWYRLSVFWWRKTLIPFSGEKWGVIKMSMKDEFLILLEDASKPNIGTTQVFERSCTWSGIENGFKRCTIETTVPFYGKIWGIDPCRVMHKNKFIGRMNKQSKE